MKFKNSILIIPMLVFSTSALAGSMKHEPVRQYHQAYLDSAKVIDATPIYRQVRINNPQRQCWDEPVRRYSGRSYSNTAGNTLIGGLLGGIVGHQFGKGRGNKAATAVGTLIGAHMGYEAGNDYGSDSSYIAYEEHCEYQQDVSYEQQLDGYNVTYRYKGELYRIQMPYDPGKRIQLRVRLTPMI